MRYLFISDLHLSSKREDLCLALVRFLDEQYNASPFSHLFLLGDIFDAWVGDDVVEPSLVPAIQALKALSIDGVKIFFQHGNRDFLVGSEFVQSIGATLLPESEVITLPSGEKALLMHGDQLCTDDVAYQAFRNQVRNPTWQAHFLSMPTQERIAFAQKARAESKSAAKEKSNEIMDVNDQAVNDALTEAQVNLLIHGHTHRPCIHKNHKNDAATMRIVLGDWDTDLWYLSCTEQGYLLKQEAL
ncbi:MAG: UDP-2,3-diacylglucosamine diphosphatase [Pontibacterium sp.]